MNLSKKPKIPYDYFIDMGFSKIHIDLAYSQTKSLELDTLVNWMLDNPEDKLTRDVEVLKIKQDNDNNKHHLLSKPEKTIKLLDRLKSSHHTLRTRLAQSFPLRMPKIDISEHLPTPAALKHEQIFEIDIKSESLTLEAAKRELLDNISNAISNDFNIWLRNLGSIIDELKSDDLRYKLLLEEMKKKSHRRIAKLLHFFFGSISTILHRSLTSCRELDLHSFYHLMNHFHDLATFTRAQRKSIIKQYETYCDRKQIKMNKLFAARILETGYFARQRALSTEEDQNIPEKTTTELEESCSHNYDDNDIDEVEVDDDTKIYALSDEWFDSFIEELDNIRKGKIEEEEKAARTLLNRIKDLNLPEKKFTGRVLESGLTDREACVICMQKMRVYLYMPCKHFLTCQDCTNFCNECPVCLLPICERLPLYWS